MKEKIKVIYIVGSGHCGSTLIDMIIGSSEKVFSTGELSFYNAYKINKHPNNLKGELLCTCKRPFNKCPLWKKIGSTGDYIIKKGFSFKENMVIGLSSIFPFLKYHSERYTDDTDKVLKVLKRKGIEYFVDSSKDPRRMFYLFNNKNLEVYPIFLSRNGLKVAHSYNKNNRRELGLKKKGYIRSLVIRWALVNIISRLLLLRAKNKPLIIKYEDFCDKPTECIKMINKSLGINIDERNYIKKTNSKIYHNIDGNQMRFKKIKEIKKQ